jgi:hypothetical protein
MSTSSNQNQNKKSKTVTDEEDDVKELGGDVGGDHVIAGETRKEYNYFRIAWCN